MEDEDSDSSVELMNAFLRSFEEYDDENTIIHEITQPSKIKNHATEMINNVLIDRAKYNMSYAAA